MEKWSEERESGGHIDISSRKGGRIKDIVGKDRIYFTVDIKIVGVGVKNAECPCCHLLSPPIAFILHPSSGLYYYPRQVCNSLQYYRIDSPQPPPSH
jgi:hypothetical protein